MKYFKTIRFKLTMWYSSLLLILSVFFILIMNLIITSHYTQSIGEMQSTKQQELFSELFPPPSLPQLLDEEEDQLQQYRNRDLYEIRKISILSLIPLIGLSFTGGYIISGQMLGPLKELNDKFNKITAQNLTQQIDFIDNDDEISQLIRNFNKMTYRLDKSFESQKQFVENSSHELKTPLAIIQTNLEAALQSNHLSVNEYKELIQTSLKSTEFMNKLIEDLLLLSILENSISKQTINLNEIIRSSIADLNVLAQKKSIIIKQPDRLPAKTMIFGNQPLLTRAIMNIIENAIKYSSEKSEISVSSKINKNSITIEITDNGDGIRKDLYQKIFERFYRIDKSRSRKTGGVGLGLSIAQKIIQLHDGKIEIKSKEGKGSTFIIDIPIQKTSSISPKRLKKSFISISKKENN
ncbi:HAMP domain-containing protein [Candidatus Dojkabacteria bacterium]|nr:HAMP domain-containing protein [Candidatus Dojkabacteria bacterium]